MRAAHARDIADWEGVRIMKQPNLCRMGWLRRSNARAQEQGHETFLSWTGDAQYFEVPDPLVLLQKLYSIANDCPSSLGSGITVGPQVSNPSWY